MKKLLTILLALIMTFSLVGCASIESAKDKYDAAQELINEPDVEEEEEEEEPITTEAELFEKIREDYIKDIKKDDFELYQICIDDEDDYMLDVWARKTGESTWEFKTYVIDERRWIEMKTDYYYYVCFNGLTELEIEEHMVWYPLFPALEGVPFDSYYYDDDYDYDEDDVAMPEAEELEIELNNPETMAEIVDLFGDEWEMILESIFNVEITIDEEGIYTVVQLEEEVVEDDTEV